MAGREIQDDWWRVDPPDIPSPFWIHGHVSFRQKDNFAGLLLGFINDGSHGVLLTDDETHHKFAVIILSSDDEHIPDGLTDKYLTFRSRWPGSRGNPIPEGIEILDKGLFWWAPGLNFLIGR